MDNPQTTKENIKDINKVTPEFLQDVIDLAVKHDRSVTFNCSNKDKFRETLKSIEEKGCRFFGHPLDTLLTIVRPPSEVEMILGDGYTVTGHY